MKELASKRTGFGVMGVLFGTRGDAPTWELGPGSESELEAPPCSAEPDSPKNAGGDTPSVEIAEGDRRT